MLTGIDIDLFVLDISLSPEFVEECDEWSLLYEGMFDAWSTLLIDNGYRIDAHTQRPSGVPYIMGFVYANADGSFDAHAFVVDEDGLIIDPAPGGLFNDMMPHDLEDWCNIVIPHGAYFTINPL